MTANQSAARLRHEALYYNDSGEYEKNLAVRIQSALLSGEPVMVAAPPPNVDRLRDVIRQNPSIASKPAVDAVTFVDMSERGRNPGRIIPQVLQAFADRNPGRRCLFIGEPVWRDRTPEEYAAAVQHEALINTALEGRDMTVVCPYDTANLPLSWLRDAERTHPVLSEAGFNRDSPLFRGAEAAAKEFNRPLGDAPATAKERSFSSPAELHGLRGFVMEFAAKAGLRRERAEDLRAAVNEVATNTLVHTQAPGLLRCWSTERQAVCEVNDRGVVNDPLFARRLPEEGQIGGNGLAMVQQLCDLVQTYVHPGGVVVRMFVGLP